MSGPPEIVVCSLEAWDDVWRRNQLVTDRLLRANAGLNVLFVEPPSDVVFELRRGRMPSRASLRAVRPDGRLHAFRPFKLLPRRLGGAADEHLRHQLLGAVRRIGFRRPVLWVNDLTYAPLIETTGWPSVYDVTDDWLVFDSSSDRERARLTGLEQVALAGADEVVVCSAALAASRGRVRDVSLIPNGVDVARFRQTRPRPEDLPSSPVAVYLGSLHDARLDTGLVLDLARKMPALSIALVGPDSLAEGTRRALAGCPNVNLLGPRPYETVPAYLQHADVIIVPHRISAFTDSLDPIKAYECLAMETPTVATPVAGFRELEDVLTIVPRDDFPAAVESVLAAPRPHPSGRSRVVRSWDETAAEFADVLRRAVST